ncbi:MAG: YkvA family protein [Pseudomonadota bacterium]
MSEQPTGQAPRRFAEFRQRADGLVESPERLQGLVKRAVAKLGSSARGGRFAEFRRQLGLAIEMLRAWLAGDYPHISRTTLVVLAAALLYFVVPLDVIPDFLFGWGLIDDVAVLTYVFGQVQEEIVAYENFKAEQAAQPGETELAPDPSD